MNGSLKKSTIEKIKDLILVVLFLLTVLLLCFFWTDISFKDISLEDFAFMEDTGQTETLDISEILIPSDMILSHGEGVYTRITENRKAVWNDEVSGGGGMLPCFAQFMQSENILFEEITKEQYDSITKPLSLRAVFDYYIPFSSFCEYEAITLPSGGSDIDAMSELTVSVGSLESFFVYDAKNNRYFRIVAGAPSQTSDSFLQQLDTAETMPYYPAKVVLGNPVENEALIPIYTETALRDFRYTNELDAKDSQTVTRIAKEFFGDSFDFIRKIEEAGGATIYMYGYGEKVLIADVDGSVEYKEEYSGSNSKATYFESLDKALSFITQHGGIYTLDGQRVDLFLKAITSPQNKEQGYRFEFGLLEKGVEIDYQESSPLVVEVTGGQVSYYKRMLPQYEPPEAQEPQEAYQVVNVLAQNYAYIYSVLTDAGLLSPAEDKELTTFNQVAEEISSIRYGYVRDVQTSQENSEENTRSGEMRAAWIVELCGGKVETYFDLQDASPLGYSIRQKN